MVSEIKSDIDFLAAAYSSFTTAFLGDADPLGMPVNDLEAVLHYLRKRIPGLVRITAYARTASLNKLGYTGIQRLSLQILGKARQIAGVCGHSVPDIVVQNIHRQCRVFTY